MADASWYVAVTGTGLEQGDLIADLPIPVTGGIQFDEGRPTRVSTRLEVVDALVLTQSCDLVQGKVGEVMVCAVASWDALVEAELARGNTAVAGSSFIEKLIEGAIPSLSLLHRRSTRPELPWSVANFRRLYTVERVYLHQVLVDRRTVRRLRLRSPYREHLAQALARYFMRVGLPHDAAPFRIEGRDAAKAVAASLRPSPG
ncbi:MAG: hypothetical protein ACRDYF_08910 [Acidimicrobiia bacterium]